MINEYRHLGFAFLGWDRLFRKRCILLWIHGRRRHGWRWGRLRFGDNRRSRLPCPPEIRAGEQEDRCEKARQAQTADIQGAISFHERRFVATCWIWRLTRRRREFTEMSGDGRDIGRLSS